MLIRGRERWRRIGTRSDSEIAVRNLLRGLNETKHQVKNERGQIFKHHP